MGKTIHNLTWEDFVHFLTIDKNHSKKSNCLSADKSRFSIIQSWFRDKEWNSDNFRKILLHYDSKNKSQGTKNKIIQMGKNIDEYLNTNITRTFRTKVEPAKRIERILTEKEIVRLAKATIPYKRKETRNHINQRQMALILLLGSIGCRYEEVASIQWQNIGTINNPQNGTLHYVEFLRTKNGKDRKVSIDKKLFQLIQKLPRISNYVFASVRGKKLSNKDINDDLKLRAKKIGLDINEGITSHLFRHSRATHLNEAQESPVKICGIFGWGDPRMLSRYDSQNIVYQSKMMENHSLLRDELKTKKPTTEQSHFTAPDYPNDEAILKFFKNKPTFSQELLKKFSQLQILRVSNSQNQLMPL